MRKTKPVGKRAVEACYKIVHTAKIHKLTTNGCQSGKILLCSK